VTGLFPCDKNIFRSQAFLLASEDIDAAPVNHPVLVKTSDQPSFSSFNFSSFTSAEAFWASDIRPVPSLNLRPNTHGGTPKKITSSPYRKFVGATPKKKIKQASKCKTNRLVSNDLLGPSKRRDPTPSDTPDSDTDLTVPFADNSMEEEEQDAECVLHWSFLWRPQVRRVDTMCEIFQMGAHTLCWYGGRFCLWAFSEINTVLFFLCICNFLNSVTILCAFWANYSPPQIRNRCAPN